jgi:hypothetical protein
MPVADSDPARRNLIVASLCFIVYYWGGGHFPDEAGIHLAVISATFTNRVFLGVMAWIILIWFFVRYQQQHKKQFYRQLATDCDHLKNSLPEVVELYIEANFGPLKAVERNNELHLRSISHDRKGTIVFKVRERLVQPGGRTEEIGNEKEIYPDGWAGRKLLARILLHNIWNGEAVANYVVPLLLFGLAVTPGLFQVSRQIVAFVLSLV